MCNKYANIYIYLRWLEFYVLYLSFEIYLDIKFTLRTWANFFLKISSFSKTELERVNGNNIKVYKYYTFSNFQKNLKLTFLRNIFHLLSSKKLPCVPIPIGSNRFSCFDGLLDNKQTLKPNIYDLLWCKYYALHAWKYN